MPLLRTLALLLAALPYAASGGYLQLPGIPGESKQESHRGWIEIESMSMGATHAGSGASGAAAGAGRHGGNCQITLTKLVDQSSTAIANAVAKGTVFATATLEYGPTRYALKTVMISSVQQSHGGTRPTETFTLNCAQMEITYTSASGNQSRPMDAKPPTAVGATAMAASPGGAPATTMAAHPPAAPAVTTAAIHPLPPPAVQKNAQLSPWLSPPARTWVNTEASTLLKSGATTDAMMATARRDASARFAAAHLSPRDIDTLVFLVLMQAANDNQQDLKQLMAQSKSQRPANAAAPSNTMSDMSQEQQLKLQQAMERQSQAEQTISNIMKSMNDTANGILSNLK